MERCEYVGVVGVGHAMYSVAERGGGGEFGEGSVCAGSDVTIKKQIQSVSSDHQRNGAARRGGHPNGRISCDRCCDCTAC